MRRHSHNGGEGFFESHRDPRRTANASPSSWGSAWVEELMETDVINHQNMAFLKEGFFTSSSIDPALLSDLRHDKEVRSALNPSRSQTYKSDVMLEAKRVLKKEEKEKKMARIQNKLVEEEVSRFQNHITKLRKMNQRLERMATCTNDSTKGKMGRFHQGYHYNPYHERADESSNELRSFQEDQQSNTLDCEEGVNAMDSMGDKVKYQTYESVSHLKPSSKKKSTLLISGLKVDDGITEQGFTPYSNFSSECQTIVFERIHQRYMESEKDRMLKEGASLIRHSSPVDDCRQPNVHQAASSPSNLKQITDDSCRVQLTEWTNGTSKLLDSETCNAEEGEVLIKQWCLPASSCKVSQNATIPPKEEEGTLSKILPLQRRSKKADENRLESMSRMYAKWMTNVCVPQKSQFEEFISVKMKPERDRDGKLKEHPNNQKLITREEKIMQVLHILQKHKKDKLPDVTNVGQVSKPHFSKSVNDIREEKVNQDGLKFRRAISGTYEHRLKAHKDVIIHQKAKLEEQKRQIEELKFSQLKMESEKSKQQTQKTLNHFLQSCDQRVKAQAKTLKSSLSLVDLSSENPFVLRMEQRAMEQRQKKLLAQERRKQFEEERKKKAKENEDKKRQEEEELLKKKHEEAQELRRKEREMREEVRREREKLISLERKADQFSQLRRLKKGFLGFKRLVELRKSQYDTAVEFYNKHLLHSSLKTWCLVVEERLKTKLAFADNFYSSNLLFSCFSALKQEVQERNRRSQVAVDMHELHLQERYFHLWLKYTHEQQEITSGKMCKADQHHNKVILKKIFHFWLRYPEIAQQERERERRKMIWRSKVQQVLPDFCPVLSSD